MHCMQSHCGCKERYSCRFDRLGQSILCCRPSGILSPPNRVATGRRLAYASGLPNQRLLLRCEYLAAENRILRADVPPRMRLTDPETPPWMAKENAGWGYDRIVCAESNLGHKVKQAAPS